MRVIAVTLVLGTLMLIPGAGRSQTVGDPTNGGCLKPTVTDGGQSQAAATLWRFSPQWIRLPELFTWTNRQPTRPCLARARVVRRSGIRK